jgi:hypothetical protein
MPMKPEPKAPPCPPPTDNVQRRESLAASASATNALRNAFSRHVTVPQDPGKNRTS